MTPLHLAMAAGLDGVSEMLLAKGADRAAKDALLLSPAGAGAPSTETVRVCRLRLS